MKAAPNFKHVFHIKIGSQIKKIFSNLKVSPIFKAPYQIKSGSQIWKRIPSLNIPATLKLAPRFENCSRIWKYLPNLKVLTKLKVVPRFSAPICLGDMDKLKYSDNSPQLIQIDFAYSYYIWRIATTLEKSENCASYSKIL